MKSTIDMIDVMEHFTNGGEVELQYKGDKHWTDIDAPAWDWTSFNYRKKEPVKKKIKMLCWYGNDMLLWVKEGAWAAKEWIRVPSEDKEIEV